MSSGMSDRKISRIWRKTNGRCAYCGRPLVREARRTWHVEHMVPRARGGGSGDKNLVLSCVKCNLKKKARTVTEFKAYVVGCMLNDAKKTVETMSWAGKMLKRKDADEINELADQLVICLEWLEDRLDSSVGFYMDNQNDWMSDWPKLPGDWSEEEGLPTDWVYY